MAAPIGSGSNGSDGGSDSSSEGFPTSLLLAMEYREELLYNSGHPQSILVLTACYLVDIVLPSVM